MTPLLTGFPFSAGAIGQATYSATTGSPTIDTSSRPGKTIIKYNASGSITIGTAGYVEVLVVGGGGAGGNLNASAANISAGGGGAGGYFYSSSIYLPAGTSTVQVGAGGAGSTTQAISGVASFVGNYIGIGGGRGSAYTSIGAVNAASGGSGGGDYTGNNSTRGTAQISGQGFNGGVGVGGSTGAGCGTVTVKFVKSTGKSDAVDCLVEVHGVDV